MNKVFLTFGNKKYHKALDRISKQINECGFFNRKYFFNEFTLSRLPNYKQIIPFLRFRRGYGFWIWKIFLINYILSTLETNDILVYADTGCYIEKNYIFELENLINQLVNEKYDNIAFQLSFIEKEWTKMDTINALDGNLPEIIETGQLVGGIQIIKKTPETIELYRKIYKSCLNLHLLDDSSSKSPNYPGFNEHRHDQSIASILRKKHSKTLIVPDYTFCSNWEFCKFPIQARRLRN